MYADSPTHLTMGRSKRSVFGQWPALGMDNSINDLKSAIPKSQEYCVTRKVLGYWKVDQSPPTLISVDCGDWTDGGLTRSETGETD